MVDSSLIAAAYFNQTNHCFRHYERGDWIIIQQQRATEDWFWTFIFSWFNHLLIKEIWYLLLGAVSARFLFSGGEKTQKVLKVQQKEVSRRGMKYTPTTTASTTFNK